MKLETEIEIAMTDNISEELRDLLSRCHKRIKALDAALQQEAEEKFYLYKRLNELVDKEIR